MPAEFTPAERRAILKLVRYDAWRLGKNITALQDRPLQKQAVDRMKRELRPLLSINKKLTPSRKHAR